MCVRNVRNAPKWRQSRHTSVERRHASVVVSASAAVAVRVIVAINICVEPLQPSRTVEVVERGDEGLAGRVGRVFLVRAVGLA